MGMDLFEILISGKINKGESVTVDELTVTENGTYTAPEGHVYNPVNVNVSGGGGDTAWDDVIEGRSTAYYNNRVSTIARSAFAQNQVLTTVDFPNATSTGSYAFMGCTQIVTASLPKLESMGFGAFSSCRLLTSANFPSITIIPQNAFTACYSLVSASFPKATRIQPYAFASCTRLASISFPTVEIVEDHAFAADTMLEIAIFPKLTSIGSWAFNSCKKLISLFLLASSVVDNKYSNIFQNTPMANSSYTGSFGSIYVPASLVSDYKVASNWSYYADRITAYEG